MFAVGSKIIVRDQANFYFGREAIVRAAETFGTVTVLTVAVENITFAIRAEKAEMVGA